MFWVGGLPSSTSRVCCSSSSIAACPAPLAACRRSIGRLSCCQQCRQALSTLFYLQRCLPSAAGCLRVVYRGSIVILRLLLQLVHGHQPRAAGCLQVVYRSDQIRPFYISSSYTRLTRCVNLTGRVRLLQTRIDTRCHSRRPATMGSRCHQCRQPRLQYSEPLSVCKERQHGLCCNGSPVMEALPTVLADQCNPTGVNLPHQRQGRYHIDGPAGIVPGMC